MEKEQIVKALEVCSNYQGFGDCDKCPAREGCDNENSFLEKEALSLIREQEKRIEYLTLEYAGFEAGAKDAARFIQAETVRKMQSEIKSRCIAVGALNLIVDTIIDAVADEMIGGE